MCLYIDKFFSANIYETLNELINPPIFFIYTFSSYSINFHSLYTVYVYLNLN